MGTRSLTHIKDDNDNTLVTIYRQYDVYPTGMGQDLKDILAPKRLGNGVGGGATLENFANGMGCAAAAVIAALKDDVGNVYIQTPDATDCWEEYVYTIRPMDETSASPSIPSMANASFTKVRSSTSILRQQNATQTRTTKNK